jgi:adenosylcobinamide-phosphate synthase
MLLHLNPKPELAQVIALSLLLGWLIDRYLGEPKSAWHPVVWIGQYLHFFGKLIAPIAVNGKPTSISASQKLRAYCLGAFFWLLAATVLVFLANEVEQVVSRFAWYWQALCLGILLKPLFSWRMLRDEVVAVESAMTKSLDAGRLQLACLVSRDVQYLSEIEVRESAIETLTENLNDSVISALLWFVLAGLPGILLYRFANTADAMWGYRGEHGGRIWTWAGKWAARADDVLSWPGARLTALLMFVGSARLPSAALWREASATTSPNGGWPMGAIALILNIRLTKPSVYVLHANGANVNAQHIGQAIVVCERAILVWFALVGLMLLALYFLMSR